LATSYWLLAFFITICAALCGMDVSVEKWVLPFYHQSLCLLT
jgi:hypothetical protein